MTERAWSKTRTVIMMLKEILSDQSFNLKRQIGGKKGGSQKDPLKTMLLERATKLGISNRTVEKAMLQFFQEETVREKIVQAIKSNRQYQLYRYWDENLNLLYIGSSRSAIIRLFEHEKDFWFNEIAMVTIENFPDRTTAKEAERTAIWKEKPQHNVTHNSQRPRSRKMRKRIYFQQFMEKRRSRP